MTAATVSASDSASSEKAAPGAEAPHRWAITTLVMLASLMQALDMTIAVVALPHMQGALSATQDQMSWVLTSYIVASAIMMPLSGWLAGRIGRKRLFLFSIGGFTLASAWCGMAQTLPEIVAARLLQGLSGAALSPMSQATLLDITPPAQHARTMAMWMMGVVVGPIVGPMLGGWLTENYSWRWVFYINVPFGIACVLGLMAFMRETPLRRSSFDFFGFVTISVAVAALQLMLDRGQGEDWFASPEIRIEALLAGLAFYLFVVHMLTSDKTKFINPALFRDRNFVAGNVFIFVVGIGLFATLALLPPLLQFFLNHPVFDSGLVLAPRGLGTMLASFIVGRFAGRVDPRLVIVFGLLVNAFSLWLMSGLTLQMDASLILWSGILQGFGIGFSYAPLVVLAFATLSPSLRDEGTAMFSLLRNLGSSIGISLVVTLLVRNTQVMHARLGEHIHPYGTELNGLTPGMLGDGESLMRLNELVTAQAAMVAYNNDFIFLMVLSLCLVPLVVFLKPVHASPKPATGGGK